MARGPAVYVIALAAMAFAGPPSRADTLESALVQAYQLRATRAAYLIVRDRPLAEDLVGDAFLRATGGSGRRRKNPR